MLLSSSTTSSASPSPRAPRRSTLALLLHPAMRIGAVGIGRHPPIKSARVGFSATIFRSWLLQAIQSSRSTEGSEGSCRCLFSNKTFHANQAFFLLAQCRSSGVLCVPVPVPDARAFGLAVFVLFAIFSRSEELPFGPQTVMAGRPVRTPKAHRGMHLRQ